MREIMDNVTIAIKTFERQHCLRLLLGSIRKFYPDINIIIADDSRAPYPEISESFGPNINHMCLDYDQGLSYGRNAMVRACDTDYILIIDDDFVFDERTRIEELYKTINDGYDIVAGAIELNREIKHFEGDFVVFDSGLHLLHKPTSTVLPVDLVFNFFLAKTQAFRFSPWDNQFNMVEHIDFFWSAKKAGLKVAYNPKVIVQHSQQRPKDYAKLRKRRLRNYEKMFLDKEGFSHTCMAEAGPEGREKIEEIKISYMHDVTIVTATILRPDCL